MWSIMMPTLRQQIAISHFVFFLLFASTSSKPTESSKEVEISEQMDPTLYTRQGMFPNGFFGRPNGYPTQFPGSIGDPNSQQVTFEFRCKCNSKVNRNSNNAQNVQIPADANAQAQQQIQQLQEQLRQQTEQLRRQQQLTNMATGFEQFANLLSVADGLDCACTGVSPNMNLNQLGPSTGHTFFGSQGFINPQIAGMVGGVPLTAPFNTRLLPLDRLSSGPMLP